MSPVQHLRLRLLGELQIEGFDEARLERRQLRTLLKILALGRGRPVGVDRLVDCLWGDESPRQTDGKPVAASSILSPAHGWRPGDKEPNQGKRRAKGLRFTG
jgi:hypothetical protein